MGITHLQRYDKSYRLWNLKLSLGLGEVVTGKSNTLNWSSRGVKLLLTTRSWVWPWELMVEAGWRTVSLEERKQRKRKTRVCMGRIDRVCSHWTDQELEQEYDDQKVNEWNNKIFQEIKGNDLFGGVVWWNDSFSYNREVSKKLVWGETVIED